MEMHDSANRIKEHMTPPRLKGSEEEIVAAEAIRTRVISEMNLSFSWVGTSKITSWEDRDLFALRTEEDLRMVRANCSIMTTSEEVRDYLLCSREGLLGSERMQRAIVAIQSNDSAKWWIDRKDARVSELLADQYRITSPGAEEDTERIWNGVAYLRPDREVEKTDTIAHIQLRIGDVRHKIEIRFAEDCKEFSNIMDDLGFRMDDYWDENLTWGRTLSVVNGNPIDITAEVGYRLLEAGFTVRIDDPGIRAKVLSGNYTPEITGSIRATKAGEFSIHRGAGAGRKLQWNKNNGVYKDIMELPGAIDNKQSIIVPAKAAKELAAFVHKHRNFEISEGAKQLIVSRVQSKANYKPEMER